MSVNFEAKVNNGTIDIPEEYRDRVKGTVHVTIVSEDEAALAATPDSIIEELLAQPLHVPGFQALTRDEIYSRN